MKFMKYAKYAWQLVPRVLPLFRRGDSVSGERKMEIIAAAERN